MTYRKNQGRYARMIAFWSLALLFAYGCFRSGGMVSLVSSWMSSDSVLLEPFPLLKQLRISSLIVIGVFAVLLFASHRVLNQPKLADLLIDTEGEMQKVTWPAWGEVQQGALAVAAMVLVLVAFLTVVDTVFTKVMSYLLAGFGGQN